MKQPSGCLHGILLDVAIKDTREDEQVIGVIF